jgi:aspartate aminotransferase
MSARARALKAKGVRVLDFTVGEPDQPTPRHVVEAGKAALDAGRTKYAPASGLPELRAAVAGRYREDFAVDFSPEDVVVTVGGKQGLALVYSAIVDGGCEVVVPIPAWPTFAEAARIAGGRAVLVPLSEKTGFRVTARAVAKALTPRTRAVVVNSPSNPTGAVIEPGELLAIARLARKRGCWLLYDDTYAQLVFGSGRAPDLQRVKDAARGRLVVVGTASKSYCMTGWRVGWLIGPRVLADACSALNSHSVQGPATFAQLAAAEALTAPQEPVRALAAEYRRRRDFIHSAVAALPGVRCARPEGGFYVFPDVSRCLSQEMPDTTTFCSRLLEEKAVAVVPGEGFHALGHFRLSFATAFEDLQEGARRLAEFVAEHGSRR